MDDGLDYIKKVNEELEKLERTIITKIMVKERKESFYDEVNPSLLR